MHSQVATCSGETISVELTPETDAVVNSGQAEQTVSTHVLVDAQQLERLRALARKTRVSQNDYLREAVQDLLTKYQAAGEDSKR
jgi:hypothetical protein